jgi:hypothetical protein
MLIGTKKMDYWLLPFEIDLLSASFYKEVEPELAEFFFKRATQEWGDSITDVF